MKEAEINEKIRNYCTAAVSYGTKLKKPLGMSLIGVMNLEKIFEIFYKDLYSSPFKLLVRRITKKGLSQEHIEAMAKILGAYLGELVRTKLGEECKWVETKESGKIGEIHLLFNGKSIFPMEKAYNRLIKGREENIVTYYKSFIIE